MVDPAALRRKLSLFSKAGALDILFELRDAPKRFTDLPGNVDTRAKRLHDLEAAGLIDAVVVRHRKRGRPRVAYQLSEKGLSALKDVADLDAGL